MATETGWQGRFFDDFEVGDIYQHKIGRTIIDPDEVWFAGITTAQNPMHYNRDYASRTKFGRQTVNAPFTNAVVTGMSVNDISMNGTDLGWDYIKVPNPVFIGETIYAQSEIIDKEECADAPGKGIITVKSIGITSQGKVILEMQRKVLVWKREFAPRYDYFPEFKTE